MSVIASPSGACVACTVPRVSSLCDSASWYVGLPRCAMLSRSQVKPKGAAYCAKLCLQKIGQLHLSS